MDAFDLVFDGMMAWNQIGLFIGGLVMFGLGALLVGDAVRWRIRGRRVMARIVDVRATGKPTVKKPKTGTEEKEEEKEVGWGPFMKEAKKSPGAAIAAFFIALMVIGIPALFICIGIYFGYDYMSLRTTGVAVPGEIVEIKSEYDSEGGTTYRPVVAFVTENGARIREEGGMATSWESFRRGEDVTVFYEREDPSRFAIKAFWYNMLLPIVFTVMGSLFLLIFTGRFPKINIGRSRPEKEKISYAGEMYYPTFEYRLPDGETVRHEGDTGTNNILNKMPGTKCTILVDPDDPEKIRRPTLVMPAIGLILAVPGGVMLYIALIKFEITMMSVLIFLAFLCIGAFKLRQTILPRDQWQTKEQFQARMAEKRRKKRSTGRMLNPAEIRDRVAYYCRVQKLWLPVMIVIGAGMIGGGYYWGLNQSDFKARALAAQGTVIDVVSEYSSGSDSGYTYYPVVSFETATGKRVRFKDSFGSNPPVYQGGEKVDVLYDPEKPRKAQISRGWLDWLPMIGLMTVGLLILLQSISVFFRLRRVIA